jgi:hypothetical protein
MAARKVCVKASTSVLKTARSAASWSASACFNAAACASTSADTPMVFTSGATASRPSTSVTPSSDSLLSISVPAILRPASGPASICAEKVYIACSSTIGCVEASRDVAELTRNALAVSVTNTVVSAVVPAAASLAALSPPQPASIAAANAMADSFSLIDPNLFIW